MQILLHSLGYLFLLYLLWDAGTWFTKIVLEKSGAGKRERELVERNEAGPPSEANHAGEYIGLFERTLIVAGLVLNNWEVILAVIALKTVARHDDLNKKIDAEYFLIGSLASISWAIGIAVLLLLYDHYLGQGFLPTTWLFGAEASA
jgi:NADH:ubiquinone oxidoreductase subunit K